MVTSWAGRPGLREKRRVEQKVAWATHTLCPLVTHTYEHTHTDTDHHTCMHTGTRTPHRWSRANTPTELRHYSWGAGELPIPQDPGFLGLCLPHPSPLRPILGPHPPVHSVPMPTAKALQPALLPSRPRASHGLAPRPFIQAMPEGPLPAPSTAKVPSHLPNRPGHLPALRQPRLPLVLPATARHGPASSPPGLPWAIRVTAITLSPLCPPLPLQEAPAHRGLTSPQPTHPGWTAPSQSPASAGPPCGDPTRGSGLGAVRRPGEEGPALWPLAASHPPGGQPAGPGRGLQCSPGPRLGRQGPVGASAVPP